MRNPGKTTAALDTWKQKPPREARTGRENNALLNNLNLMEDRTCHQPQNPNPPQGARKANRENKSRWMQTQDIKNPYLQHPLLV